MMYKLSELNGLKFSVTNSAEKILKKYGFSQMELLEFNIDTLNENKVYDGFFSITLGNEEIEDFCLATGVVEGKIFEVAVCIPSEIEELKEYMEQVLLSA